MFRWVLEMLVALQFYFISLTSCYINGMSIENIVESLVVQHSIKVVKVSQIGNVTDNFMFFDNGASYMVDSLRAIEFAGSFLHLIVTDGFNNLL